MQNSTKFKQKKIKTASQEFDAFSVTYDDQINSALAFAGQDHDFYLRVKAEHLLDVARLNYGNKVKILDIGCGHGLTHRHLLSRKGVNIELHGVDPAASVIEMAKKENPSVKYTACQGQTLPYEDNTFDIAHAMCVMHHVPPSEWLSFLREAKRVTKPGGLVMIYEHNPLNPLTQYIVTTCPIDENAVLLSSWRLKLLMRRAGLLPLVSQFILFTPFGTPFFRWLDKAFWWLPLGAQYVAMGRKK